MTESAPPASESQEPLERSGVLHGIPYTIWRHNETAWNKPVLFLPGLGVSANRYTGLKELFDTGHDVIRFDYSSPEHPSEEAKRFPTVNSALVGEAERMFAVLTDLGLGESEVDIVAHSTGGVFAVLLQYLSTTNDSR